MSSPTLFVSGHRTDESGRPTPRFPESAVRDVTHEIEAMLEAWEVGDTWTVMTGGARGTDLIAAECALNRGARVQLCLAMPENDFVRRSVTDRTTPDVASSWHERYVMVRDHPRAEVLELPEGRRPGDPTSSEAFEKGNQWMLDRLEGADRRYGLLVWDGHRSNGTGGTWQVVQRLATVTASGVEGPPNRLRVIDPTPRASSRRQNNKGKKRILSLDGGGFRGVISLEILAQIERVLGESHSDVKVLADYFDFFAGTSTGAIIATMLAYGRPVEEIQKQYSALGHSVFRKDVRALPRLARFRAKPLSKALAAYFAAIHPGSEPTLGDPALRTMLLLVMHNVRTDSPWLLTNCTAAKYNRAERMLPPHEDRNLDLQLVPLLRASTAAPTYFAPQELKLGKQAFTFQDGGVTSFNNPALIAAVVATLPNYGMSWATGANDLLVVSVGTGSSAAVPRKGRNIVDQSIKDMRQLVPSVFMNGSAFSQDLLCRVFGRCIFGPSLDTEVGDLVRENAQTALGLGGDPTDPGQALGVREAFTYVRYNADLSDKSLDRALGIDGKTAARVRKLDCVADEDTLTMIGKHAAKDVKAEHLDGFWSRPASALTDLASSSGG